MPRLKEPRFFTYDGRKNDTRIPVRTFEDYVALFAPAGAETAVGEASPFYLDHPRAPERIHTMLPRVKLIMSPGNPIERSFSLYQMNLRERDTNRGLPFIAAFQRDEELQKGYAPASRAILPCSSESGFKSCFLRTSHTRRKRQCETSFCFSASIRISGQQLLPSRIPADCLGSSSCTNSMGSVMLRSATL